MHLYRKALFILLLMLLLSASSAAADFKKPAASPFKVPILLYHRFGPVASDMMTVTTPVFESHLRYLNEHGYTVIPLKQLVDYCLRIGPPPPPRSVVIVSDDGHKTVYTDMFPLVKKYRIPVTLFIYPSAISHAPYAMTWDQLREMKKSGFFDIQSHSYWHPNFKRDKIKLTPAEYAVFVDMQLKKSKEKIEKELGGRVDMIAWPFGIYDDDLTRKAREAGYRAAFTIKRHHAGLSDNVMALPRYIMTDSSRGKVFERILNGE